MTDIVGDGVALKAASAISQYVPVQFLQGGSALNETVIANGSYNVMPIGISRATAATYGDPIAVVVDNGAVFKGIAAASLGAGAPVAVGSTNGKLIPLMPSGLPAEVASGAAVAARFAVGIALSNAVSGDTFRVLVNPVQVI